MREVSLTPLQTLVLADTDTTIVIPNGPGSGGEPHAYGFMFIVVDNMGTATAHNIALSGPIAGGTSGTAISTNYGSAILIWTGATFNQIVGP